MNPRGTYPETETPAKPPEETRFTGQQQEIDLLDLALILTRHRRMILRFTAAVSVLAVVITLLMPNIYTGRTALLPPQQSQSIAFEMLSQLGPLAGLAGRQLGVGSASDLYADMLKSRTVAAVLVRRFNLMDVYGMEKSVDAREALASRTRINVAKNGIITVEYDDRDPQRAADIANAYVEELKNLTQTLAVTEASRRRIFFQEQTEKAKDDLAEAEVALKETQEKTGIIQPEGQARVILETIAQVRGRITALEVQLRGLRSFATSEHPDVMRLEQQLSALRGELAKLQREGKGREPGDIQVPTSEVPAAGLEYIRRFRDVKYHEAIYTMLAKQFEIAKVDEGKNATVIQALDPATVPERKSKPFRSLIVLLATLSAALVACIWAFLLEAGERARMVPEHFNRIQSLRQELETEQPMKILHAWRERFRRTPDGGNGSR